MVHRKLAINATKPFDSSLTEKLECWINKKVPLDMPQVKNKQRNYKRLGKFLNFNGTLLSR